MVVGPSGPDWLTPCVHTQPDRTVLRSAGEEWARSKGMLYIETSAMTKVGIEQVFQEVAEKIMDTPALLEQTTPASRRGDSIDTADLAGGSQGGGAASGGGCCG